MRMVFIGKKDFEIIFDLMSIKLAVFLRKSDNLMS